MQQVIEHCAHSFPPVDWRLAAGWRAHTAGWQYPEVHASRDTARVSSVQWPPEPNDFYNGLYPCRTAQEKTARRKLAAQIVRFYLDPA